MLIGEAPEYDLHYVQNLTFRLDLWILFDTVMEIVVASSLNGLENIQRGPAPTSANEPKCSFDPPRESLMQVEPDARVFGAGHRDLGAGIRSTYDWFLAEHAADGELRGMISESEAV